MRSLRKAIKNTPPLRAGMFLVQNSYHGARSVLWPSRPQAPRGGEDRFLTAMIRVKNEARFLPEWLAHHLTIGVEHCFVYDNNSSDDTETVIAPFVERGLATYIPWPTVPASPSSHIDFLTRFGHTSRWVAFFDADELLVEQVPGALLDTLRSFDDRPAVAVNGRYFGSAGHETIPRGLVTERFDRADTGCNHHVKVVARPSKIHRYRNSHNFYFARGRLAVTPDGRRVYGSFVTPSRHPRLVLHHYVYRSRQDYERKGSLGFVDAAGTKDRARTASLAEREFHRHNDVRVEMDERTCRATAELLQRLGYPDEIWAFRAEPSATTSPGPVDG